MRMCLPVFLATPCTDSSCNAHEQRILVDLPRVGGQWDAQQVQGRCTMSETM